MVTMDLKKYFEHKSLYSYTPAELRVKLKKEIENIRIYAINSLIGICIGVFLFYQGYQHLSIIVCFSSMAILICSMFQSQYVTMMEQAIFLMEHTEPKEASRFA